MNLRSKAAFPPFRTFSASALRNGDDQREEDRSGAEGRANSEPCSIATRRRQEEGDAQEKSRSSPKISPESFSLSHILVTIAF